MSSSSIFKGFTEDKKGDGNNWRRKILVLLMCFLLVILGLLVALIIVSVKLADQDDPISENLSRNLGGLGEWKRFGRCSKECGNGTMTEERTCYILDGNCSGIKTRQVQCNQHECQGIYKK